MNFEMGDLIIIEIALNFFFKDIDLSLSCAKQIQQTIAKAEFQIAQLQAAFSKQESPTLQPEANKPTNT